MTEQTMSYADMVRTSNEWMRRYVDEPEQFNAEFRTVAEFMAEQSDGKEPSYGDRCTAYQFKLLEELNAQGARPARSPGR